MKLVSLVSMLETANCRQIDVSCLGNITQPLTVVKEHLDPNCRDNPLSNHPSNLAQIDKA